MIVLQPLTARHDLSRFRSGNSLLDSYLQRDALKEQNADRARVFVAVDPDEDATRPLGYFALSATGYYLPTLDASRQPVTPETFLYPAYLAFLARDSAWRGRGLGDLLLVEALKKATAAAECIGLPGILLETTKEGAALYERFGFVRIDPLESYLYLPIGDAREILRESGVA